MDDRSSIKEARRLLRWHLRFAERIQRFEPVGVELVTPQPGFGAVRMGREHGIGRRVAKFERWRMPVLLLASAFQAGLQL